MIEVKDLSKRYTVYKRRGLFREKQRIQALDNLSFSVERGAFLGYIGPNGAGKSTTVKVLTGVIVPEEGSVSVDGFCPWKNRKQYVEHIGVVFGQKSQLWWDLPVIDTYRALGALYDVPKPVWLKRVAELSERLSLSDFLYQPARQLSLGQRMRAEVGASLIHDPDILFLDEPSIGMDVVSRHQMAAFLKELNGRGKTIFLTTHDLHEIASLCRQILLLHRGRLVFFGPLEALKDMIHLPTIVRARVSAVQDSRDNFSIKTSRWQCAQCGETGEITVEVPAGESTVAASKWLMENYPVEDLKIEEPDIEEIVKLLYHGLIGNSKG